MKPSNWQSFPLPSQVEWRNYVMEAGGGNDVLAEGLWNDSTGLPGLLTARRGSSSKTNKPRGERDYVYEPDQRRYRDMTTGRLVTEKQTRNAVLKVARETEKQLKDNTRQLLAGSILFIVWYYRSRDLLLALYRSIFTLSIGGLLFDNQTHREAFYALTLLQFKRFDNFARDLDNAAPDSYVMNSAVSRAGSYGAYGNALLQNMKLDIAYLDGHTEARRVLGPNENHCHDYVTKKTHEFIHGCPELASLGWIPIGQMVPISDTLCRVNCKCTIETRRSAMYQHHAGGYDGHQPHPDGSPQSVHGGGETDRAEGSESITKYKNIDVEYVNEMPAKMQTAFAYYDKSGNGKIVVNKNRLDELDSKGISLNSVFEHEYTHHQFEKSKLNGAFGLRLGHPAFNEFGSSEDEIFFAMQKTGRVTGYANIFWQNKNNFALSINETLSEISRLSVDAPIALKEIDPRWLKLHKFVMDSK